MLNVDGRKTSSVTRVHKITPTPIMTLKNICQIYKFKQNLAEMNRLWFEAIKRQVFVFYVTIQIGETVLHALQEESGEITAKHSQWMMSLQE